MRVIVIGAGIGGLSTAIALRKAGLDVTVYERAAELTEVGAGISLWANALRALDHIGAGDAVRAVSLDLVRSEFRVNDGRTTVASYQAAVFERRYGVAPFVAMCHRADLIAALGGCLPAGVVRCGHECVGVEQTADRVSARFANGHIDTADVLVGADGIKSVVRAQLFGPEPQRYSGYTCWRGVCPRPAALSPGDAGEWWGRGRRFGITTLPGDRVYWYTGFNAPAGQRAADEKAAVTEAFRGWADPVPELIASTPPAAVLRNDSFDRPPNMQWAKGRALLLGDAAHPTTPNLGQGGCMAIEDAVVLARCLKRGPDVPASLTAFVEERFARTTAVTNESWRLGRVGQWDGRAACWLRDRLFRVLFPLVGEKSFTKYATFDVGAVG
jgi:2-polyprenyl-6-methoxyphenol hydroxylase-like FAD-dependent oxidoreductase